MTVPAVTVFGAFFVLPMAQLALTSAEGPLGWGVYFLVFTSPRYFQALMYTILLSAVTTLVTLVIAGVSGVFLTRNDFPGKSVLISLLTFPLIFPGVVVGFMVIFLMGRAGVVGNITMLVSGERLVLAYGIIGLFMGYLYFSIPRVILIIMAAVQKIDTRLEEAARSLGASPLQVVKDVLIPALVPSLISSGAICFATSMGAFGTAFTLATDIDVLPIVVYTEFTFTSQVIVAAALAIILGIITWLALSIARMMTGAAMIGAGG